MIEEMAKRVQESIQRVIVGRDEAIELLLVALLCEGHVLIEDVPGIGKTTLARAVAASLGCSFSRLQCTPDLLPSDVTGVTVYDQRSGDFDFRPGPVVSQILLADEINRATPRTQSALLEAMQERQITVDGRTHPLPRPFLVIATQNPVELEGTYPLPEAQIDRFMMMLSIGYPTEDEEHAILLRFERDDPLRDLQAVTDSDELREAQRRVREIHVEGSVRGYVVRIARATREHADIKLGVSPRATLALYRGAQALAAMRGRTFVLPDDVKEIAPYVLTHRLMIGASTRLRGREARDVLVDVMEAVPVPVEEVG